MFGLYTSELASLASTSHSHRTEGIHGGFVVCDLTLIRVISIIDSKVYTEALWLSMFHGSLCTTLSVGHALLTHSYGLLVPQWLEVCRLHFSVASWNTPMMPTL